MAQPAPQPTHPGDIIQAVIQGPMQGHLLLVQQVKRWGVGALLRWVDSTGERETYFRLKPDEYVVIGGAHILPSDIAEARRDSIATAQSVENDRMNNI